MVVSVRFWLSRLGERRARRAASRWLLLGALAGYGLTLLFLTATGRGTGQWFFLFVVWIGLIFLPLWLLTQAFQSIGPSLRRGLAAGLAGRADRYDHPANATLVVEDLFDRVVVMPRISTPEQAGKAREAASALMTRAGRTNGVLARALRSCLATLEVWTREVSRWAAADAAENIQARWAEIRALAALAGLTRTLLAVSQDQRSGALPLSGPAADPERVHAFLDAVLDYCDELALEVEVLPWTEPPLGLEVGVSVREPWQRYVETPSPAPSALEAFIQATLHA
ncbi:MAG TPA: hypothetical protein VGR25_07065 [bacterium]|jgi:hypothetical protein|nr:hypothetical protein [bacterium]